MYSRCWWNFHPLPVTRAHWCAPLFLFYNSVHSFSRRFVIVRSRIWCEGGREGWISFWRIYFQRIHLTNNNSQKNKLLPRIHLQSSSQKHLNIRTRTSMMIRRDATNCSYYFSVTFFVAANNLKHLHPTCMCVSQKWMFCYCKTGICYSFSKHP